MNNPEKFWDKFVNKWDKQAKSHTHIKSVENIKKYLNGSDIVLDYGCGIGTVSTEIAGNIKKIHGIDISSKMIDAAKKRSREA